MITETEIKDKDFTPSEWDEKITSLMNVLKDIRGKLDVPEITFNQALQSNNFMNAYIVQERHKRSTMNFTRVTEAKRLECANKSMNFALQYQAEQKLLDLIL